MKEVQLIEFKGKLQKLCEDYGLKNISFCAETSDDERDFVGMIAFDNPSYRGMVSATYGIGRLWERSRSIVDEMLNEFERKRKR